MRVLARRWTILYKMNDGGDVDVCVSIIASHIPRYISSDAILPFSSYIGRKENDVLLIYWYVCAYACLCACACVRVCVPRVCVCLYRTARHPYACVFVRCALATKLSFTDSMRSTLRVTWLCCWIRQLDGSPYDALRVDDSESARGIAVASVTVFGIATIVSLFGCVFIAKVMVWLGGIVTRRLNSTYYCCCSCVDDGD